MRWRETEKNFQETVVQLATLTHWLAYHTYESRRSAAGFPDLVLVRPGDAVLFVELKTASGRVRPAQEHWLSVLGQVDRAETHLWRPADWPAIANRLQRR